MRYLLALALLLVSADSLASWGADMESGAEGWSMAVVMCAWIAAINVCDGFRDSRRSGFKRAAIWAVFFAAALTIPGGYALMALLALAFLLYGAWTRVIR